MTSSARLLGGTLATAGRSLRAWRRVPCGPTVFAAMGVAEILLHADDITRTLGMDWLPSASLCVAVLDRLFPGAPPGEPVRVLLWCTGRGELDALPRRTSWVWKAALPDRAHSAR
ncbi:hypothetical protein ABZ858_22995 [Streptomyces sp. NPDC047017]|uniref:hypothetical protein n=1 Tax=Streptomyces sp. NPDC047017 TaxID=3155024 RepID=UPI0033ED8344